MIDAHEAALNDLLQAYDERLAAAPLIDRRTADRRGARQPAIVDATRVRGPVDRGLAYWVLPRSGIGTAA